MKILLLLSNGHASVERGFSANRQVETENMNDEIYVAQHLVCDYMKSVGGISKIIVDKELLLLFAGARQKYSQFLDDKNHLRAEREKGEKQKLLTDEIEELKRTKKRM